MAGPLARVAQTQPAQAMSSALPLAAEPGGIRASTFYQSPEAWRQPKLIAFEQRTSHQAC